MFEHGARGLRAAMILFGLTVLMTGCSDSGVFPSFVEWTIEDACDDGLGLQVRFFDIDGPNVWPSDTDVFVVPENSSDLYSIDWRRYHRICLGATTDPETSGGWGRLIDGSGDCVDCCLICGEGETRVAVLDCP